MGGRIERDGATWASSRSPHRPQAPERTPGRAPEVRAGSASGAAASSVGAGPPTGADRIWTVPNVLSMARLAGVPVYLWWVLEGWLGWAVTLLVVSSLTDFLDGVIARRLGQITRLGQTLDPVADRLFILSTLFGLWWVGALPVWFIAALILRDAAGSVLVARVRRLGYRGLPVHDVGKAGTCCLLVSFPTLLLAYRLAGGAVDVTALTIGWAFAWWGLVLYWISFWYYLIQLRELSGGGSA